MFCFVAAITAIAAAAAPLGAALPHSTETGNGLLPRANATGYVIQPTSGTSILSIGGAVVNDGAGGISFIPIQYEKGDNTIGVDIYLQDPTGAQADQYLVYDVGNPEGNPIVGYFSPPSEACGNYNLVFIEHYSESDGNVAKTQTADFPIDIYCNPIQ